MTDTQIVTENVTDIQTVTEIDSEENTDKKPESSTISGASSSTSFGPWFSSALARLTGSGSSSQSVLSFDRLIPRSGEAVNRKRPGKHFFSFQNSYMDKE